MNDEDDLQRLAGRVAERLQELNIRLASAESCTGGWLAKTATDLPGSSRWFERGFVTYSNEAKQDLLGVRQETLNAKGAVSAETAQEMAAGVLAHSRAQVAVAITGIAGPGGATPDKPVGLVWFGWAREGFAPVTRREQFDGDREAVRLQAVRRGWEGLLEILR